MDIRTAIAELTARRDLGERDMEAVVRAIMAGEATPVQIAALLVALRMKGECVAEIAGAARAMREHATRVPTSRDVVDTCGTGGDLRHTFNISTAAALLAAGAGLPIAKHGNRAMSGAVGGADVLEALGARIDLDATRAGACLEAVGIAFLFAQTFHPAMRHVAPVRRELGVRTIFNLLGPLTNPAGARRQVLGVFAREWVEPLAQALGRLGSRRALVVHGEDGLDEVTLAGPTRVTEVSAAGLRNFTWTPADFGITPAGLESLQVVGPEDSARVIRGVLAAKSGPATDIVLLNAAAALWLAGKAESPAGCTELAREAIESGAALSLLERLAKLSNE